MTMLWQDLRYAFRTLGKSKGFTAVAVLTLALGIGATSTIYSLVDTLLLHDVTAREPERLVSFNSISYPTYRDVRDSGAFEGLAAGNQTYPDLRWSDGDQSREIIADSLSANFFEVVGGHAALGRLFTADEAAPEKNPRVVVISNRFWQRRLNGDPNIIGRALTLNNTPFTVIGVLPSNYRAIQGFGIDPDLFVPFNTVLQPSLLERRAGGLDQMHPIGRLAKGRTREQTQQILTAVLHGLEQQFPNRINLSLAPPVLMPVEGLAKYDYPGYGRSVLTFSGVLSAVALLVMLIACANVASLLLARGVARRREIAVRFAIGAIRIQLVRQLLVETAIVAAAGTAAGIGVTFLAASLLTNVGAPVQDVTVRFDFSPDWRFACAAAALGTIAALISGVVPALASSRIEISKSLRVNGNVMAPRLRFRSVLVTAQIAISVILLSGAFLFVRNVVNVLRGDPGFDAVHTAWFDIAIDRRLARADQVAMRDHLYRALESHPGVEAVSWAWYLPFQVVYPQPLVRRADAGVSESFRMIEQGIGPGYLKTMGISLLAGREFDWNDLKTSDQTLPQPVIVNQAFVHSYFHDQSPIDERLLRVGQNGTSDPMVIIGVSANTNFRSPGEEPVPLLQSLSTITPSFLVRFVGSAAQAAPELARDMDRYAPGAAIGYFTTRERLDQATWSPRAATVLLGILAAVGLVLALIGLCGISIYNVMRRTPEIGIRMALGATTGNVMRLMLRDSLTLVTTGAGVGIACSLALNRFLSEFLSAGIRPWDPLAFGAMVATLAITAGFSVWIPSQRAARVDPVKAIRWE